MKFKQWLNKWNLDSLKINAQFLELELSFNDADRKAAWEMYVELLTRITTQRLPAGHGDEKTALDSVFALFKITRGILREYGPEAIEFSKIAIVVLNQVIRPFTAEWHKKSLTGAFDKPDECDLFRKQLSALQIDLRNYTKLLSDIAGVEDLTGLEAEG